MAKEEGKEEGKKVAAPAQPRLILYSFDKDNTQHHFSSFVTKLQFRLRYAGITYESAFGSRPQAPKGKIPYVRFLDDSNELMGDSTLVAKRLIDAGEMEDLNAALSPEVRAHDLCLRSMIEDNMYFLLLYERWNENHKAMRDDGPWAHLRGGIRHVFVGFVFRFVRLMLYFQGTGRHSPEEIKRFQTEAIGALADLATAAKDKTTGRDTEPGQQKTPFWILGGEKPTEADFSLFGYLSGLLVTPTQPATVALIKSHPALVDYVERIHKTYFADFRDLGL
ncbi:hypothetical protein B0H63DRAFT_459413 [Podospora didyma]|uniref:Thioredoxin-like fold domain-containing protein n=1 Tax=Podospora didyma TaxID=330526 RepID=A0AAE0U809_9PEZI|nr:hypothetical protein B0H63DRAFT_459413 [Podospora didyma]